jgi:hypothetical protein
MKKLAVAVSYKVGQKVKNKKTSSVRTVTKVSKDKVAWSSKTNKGVCLVETMRKWELGLQ